MTFYFLLQTRLNIFFSPKLLEKYVPLTPKNNFHLITDLVIFVHKRHQLWKLEGSTLVNKNKVWQSNAMWEFMENDESLISIRNITTSNKVLTAEVNSEKVTEKARHLKLILYLK